MRGKEGASQRAPHGEEASAFHLCPHARKSASGAVRLQHIRVSHA